MSQPISIDLNSSQSRAQRTPHARGTLTVLLLALGCSLAALGCQRGQAVRSPGGSAVSPQQSIVDRSNEALGRLRSGVHRAEFEANLRQAKGVMVFPRVVKASLLFGGEGGNGVLTVRRSDGSWSEPAFYSLGAPSVGLQIGYQQATVVLFIMDDATLNRMFEANVEVGTKSGVALGKLGRENSVNGVVLTRSIYQLVEADGVFAGVSLDGYVLAVRPQHNQAYCGRAVTPRDILFDRKCVLPGAEGLRRTLAQGAPGKTEESPALVHPQPNPALDVKREM